MPTTVEYRDRTMAFAAEFMWTAALAGVAVIGLSLAGIVDLPVRILLVLTVFCAFVAWFYRSAVPVTVEIDSAGIRKQQGLGMGWELPWPAVSGLTLVALKHPRLAVSSDDLRRRRPLSEWPLRSAPLPQRTRSVPATPAIIAAAAEHSGRHIDEAS